MAVIQIDMDELAAAVTEKIRDEISKIKIIDFAEILTVQTVPKGHKATVKLAGASSASIPLDCITSYTPTVGDWVLLVYPKNSSPVIVGKCPI